MNSSRALTPDRRLRLRGLLGRLTLMALVFSTVLAVAAPPAPVAASSKLCAEQISAEVARMATALKVPVPPVNLNQPSSSYQVVSGGNPGALNFEACVSKSVIAHEFGHYVVDRAARFNWDVHLFLAGGFTKYRNWLRTSTDPSGVERAAHCVGYQLIRNGTYTRCPHSGARKMARTVVALAQW
jgi:hypothetical protein